MAEEVQLAPSLRRKLPAAPELPTPVPPRTVGNVPLETLLALRLVRPEPLPAKVLAVLVRLTALETVPAVRLAGLRLPRPEPLPAKAVALAVPMTSSAEAGFSLPMPTFPFARITIRFRLVPVRNWRPL